MSTTARPLLPLARHLHTTRSTHRLQTPPLSTSSSPSTTSARPHLVPRYVGPIGASYPTSSLLPSSSSAHSPSPSQIRASFRRLTALPTRPYSTRPTPRQPTTTTASSTHPASSLVSATAAALCSTLVLLFLSTRPGSPSDSAHLYADDSTPRTQQQQGPTLLCLIGAPRSGKTTQAHRLVRRFPAFSLAAPSSLSASDAALYVVDGEPNSPAALHELEQRTGTPVWCVVFFDLSLDEFRRRWPDDAAGLERWRREREGWEEVVRRFRDKGNVLEISAQWVEEEVWEQVEAKVEQVVELRERGEELGA